MTPQIVLVSEAPGSHDQVVRSLAAAGFQVVPQATLRAAVSLLRDAENAVLAMVLDVPLFSSIDADVLADLTVQHPRVRMMVFAWRGRQQEALRRIESCPQISTFSTPCMRPTDCRQRVRRSPSFRPMITMESAGVIPQLQAPSRADFSSLRFALHNAMLLQFIKERLVIDI